MDMCHVQCVAYCCINLLDYVQVRDLSLSILLSPVLLTVTCVLFDVLYLSSDFNDRPQIYCTTQAVVECVSANHHFLIRIYRFYRVIPQTFSGLIGLPSHLLVYFPVNMLTSAFTRSR